MSGPIATSLSGGSSMIKPSTIINYKTYKIPIPDKMDVESTFKLQTHYAFASFQSLPRADLFRSETRHGPHILPCLIVASVLRVAILLQTEEYVKPC